MFVLVTDGSTRHASADWHPRTFALDPASMVWVDPEEQEEEEEQRTEAPGPLTLRVFGPFATYEEGVLAASALAIGDDYWVIRVDPVPTTQQH